MILCAVILSGLILVFPVFAEMKKVDDKELARTNAPLAKTASPKAIPANAMFDNTAMISSQPANKATESFNLNLSIGPDTWTYTFSVFNSSYWGGGVSGVSYRAR